MKKHLLTINKDGRFTLPSADDFSYLYMPLFNEHGIKSAITPSLAGDTKLDQFHYGLTPVSAEDLVHSLSGRNVFFNVDNQLWAISGKTPYQKLNNDVVTLEGGLLYQTVTRRNVTFSCQVTSFVPSAQADIELHRFTFTNLSQKSLNVQATIGVPLFGRSADNIRDHRHVTSLLNRGFVVQDGIVNTPSMKFDERGHRVNGAAYGVFSKSSLHDQVSYYHPLSHEFVGEGGDMFFPLAARSTEGSRYQVGDSVSGYEMIGGLGYSPVSLAPNQTLELLMAVVIGTQVKSLEKTVHQYLDFKQWNPLFETMKTHWQNELNAIDFTLGDDRMTGWAKWVTLQPTMRQIYGCSFLPHHDYGRGGRGWRDLWQDSLSLIFKYPDKVRPDILGHFAGVRIDGSNATIVGINRGEFLADRNKIVRIWSDHAAWPLLTVERYLSKTGDFDFLFEKQTYFKDKFACYTHEIDPYHTESHKNILTDMNNTPYEGSVLEHLLLENLVPFFNVGAHGNVRIEDADWNDGMDMAKENGETVAFTALYTGNLHKLVELLKELLRQGISTIPLLKEAKVLFDTANQPIDYQNHQAKKNRLKLYFDSVRHQVSGEVIDFPIQLIIDDLTVKYMSFFMHINTHEWMDSTENDLGWYNGYYDNHGHRLESTDSKNIRMTLTGQTFALLGKVASPTKITKIVESVNRYLLDPAFLCPRLNTDFVENTMSMGRFMGFAYGHKENGAMFSHMAVMYAYGLLDNGFVKEGHAIIDNLYHYMSNVDQAKILPGIPEYIDMEGRGMYHYLTGSASWMVLTYIEQIFGLRGIYGNLQLEPKLILTDFAQETVRVNTLINNHLCEIVYHNPDHLDYGQYVITAVNGKTHNAPTYLIDKKSITALTQFNIILGRKHS